VDSSQEKDRADCPASGCRLLDYFPNLPSRATARDRVKTGAAVRDDPVAAPAFALKLTIHQP